MIFTFLITKALNLFINASQVQGNEFNTLSIKNKNMYFGLQI